MKKEFNFDVIVIGGGHAGCEAAYISATLKVRTLLLTINLDTIGETPCNPAFGGAGKSQIIREIDALGGIMPRITDRTAIQVRMINTKGGAAVHSLRMQIDREKYRNEMKVTLEKIPDLFIKQGKVKQLLFDGNGVCGVLCNTGSVYHAKKIIIAAGTFLGGKVILGDTEYNAGRYGEPGSYSLSKNLKEIGFKVFKLKTGTTPRIAGKSIDFSKLEKQEHENIVSTFSIWEKNRVKEGRNCYVVRTDNEVHDIIRENIKESPLFKGIIEGKGPRYCPSIEDKVVRFFDKDNHKIFLEPEGNNTDEYYMQGFSSSLPEKVQNKMIKKIKGLENAHIFKPGYAVEYYSIDSTQLNRTLESKNIKGLYFAGQVNGTSGYEEAGAQGIIAGINAALSIKCREEFTLSREESYIGTLIDDLVLKGTEKEPYRMFTSRMDNRMIARQDNAHFRLSEKAFRAGCLSDEQISVVRKNNKKIYDVIKYIKETKYKKITIYDHLKRQETSLEDFPDIIKTFDLGYYDIITVESDIKYEGYIQKHKKYLDMNREWTEKEIPEKIEYSNIPNLTIEARQKLEVIRPQTIGEAGRVSGISSSDITALIIHIRRNFFKEI